MDFFNSFQKLSQVCAPATGAFSKLMLTIYMLHLREGQVTQEGHELPSSVTKTQRNTKFGTMLHVCGCV